MEITDQLVDKLAHLARLKFNPSEKEVIREDLIKMIRFVEKINELDLAEVTPQLHMTSDINRLREDEVKESLERTEALKNAPEHDKKYFLVPKAIKTPGQNQGSKK